MLLSIAQKADTKMKPKIVYMGTPEFAVAPLNALLENGYDVAVVVTVPDKQSGRGLKINESAVKKFAVEKNLPLLQPVSLKDEGFLQELSKIGADLFIVVAFRMLPKIVWSMPKMGTFNLHASLLPQYRGAAPINWAIINGEKKSGITTFLIDEEIDTGRILMQREVDIEEEETVGTLYDKLMEKGATLVVETVKGLMEKSLEPFAQPAEELAKLHSAPKITKELCRIEWEKPALQIDRLIKGLSPYPAAFTTLSNGKKSTDLKIYKAATVECEMEKCGSIRPGSIKSDNKSYLEIGCGEGTLRLLEVQAAGKKRMNIKEFLAGFREAESYKAI